MTRTSNGELYIDADGRRRLLGAILGDVKLEDLEGMGPALERVQTSLGRVAVAAGRVVVAYRRAARGMRLLQAIANEDVILTGADPFGGYWTRHFMRPAR